MFFVDSSAELKHRKKLQKANAIFAKQSKLGKTTIIAQLQNHINGDSSDPNRKLAKFFEDNNAQDLAKVALLSESAVFLRRTTGRKYQLSHLVPLAQSKTINRPNNIANLAVILAETNQIVKARRISRHDLEILDRLVLIGEVQKAKELANRVCS